MKRSYLTYLVALLVWLLVIFAPAASATATFTPACDAAGTELKKDVEAMKNPNLHAEQSYKDRGLVKYGTEGSVRPDVGVGNNVEKPLLIIDMKTGNAKLKQSQIDKIQKNVPELPGGIKVPVIEMRPQKIDEVIP